MTAVLEQIRNYNFTNCLYLAVHAHWMLNRKSSLLSVLYCGDELKKKNIDWSFTCISGFKWWRGCCWASFTETVPGWKGDTCSSQTKSKQNSGTEGNSLNNGLALFSIPACYVFWHMLTQEQWDLRLHQFSYNSLRTDVYGTVLSSFIINYSTSLWCLQFL